MIRDSVKENEEFHRVWNSWLELMIEKYKQSDKIMNKILRKKSLRKKSKTV